MKLYATTTSERASKGQGGEWLDINIKDERKVTFAIIKVRKEKGLFFPAVYVESVGKVETTKLDDVIVTEKNAICADRTCNDMSHGHSWQRKGEKKKDECDGKHATVHEILKCADCTKLLDRM